MCLERGSTIFLNSPDAPESESSAIRYVPMPARQRLVETLRDVDLRLVASGHVHQRRDFTFGRTRHVWSPSTGFIISDAKQERIGLKEVGLVEYRVRLILSDYRREGLMSEFGPEADITGDSSDVCF